MKKTSINILGCCVSRDLFGLFKDNGGFDIRQCVTNISIMSVCSPKIAEESICTESDFANSNHYAQRCTCIDINKNAFEYLSQYDADYTIVDLGILFSVYTLKVRTSDGKSTYITNKIGLKQNPDFLENAPFTIEEKFRFPEHKDLFFGYIREYAKLIKQHIDHRKIIILELPLTQRYIDTNGEIQYFHTDENAEEIPEGASLSFNTPVLSKYLKRAYKIFESYFPQSYVVKCPNTEVLCNQNHKWGLHPLHYVIEYYRYALDAIRAITSVQDRKNAGVMVDSLNTVYTDLLQSKYGEIEQTYTLQNCSVISSDAVNFGSKVTICFNAGGGTGKYTYSAYIRRKNELIWKPLGSFQNGLTEYRPIFCGVYEICVKVKDENNVQIKKYFDFIVK